MLNHILFLCFLLSGLCFILDLGKDDDNCLAQKKYVGLINNHSRPVCDYVVAVSILEIIRILEWDLFPTEVIIGFIAGFVLWT